MKELKDALSRDFDVEFEVEEMNINEDATLILYFKVNHTNTINKNLSLYPVEAMAKSAEMIAKHNSFVPPFASTPKVVIQSKSPYIMAIKGLTPIVYFFVKRILVV